MKHSLLAALFFLIGFNLFAQQKSHTVQPKETVYGISKQYGISQEELKNANPFLKQRELQIGDVLVIPGGQEENDGQIVPHSVEPEEVFIPQADENFIYIEVKSKQTIYSLTKEYGISENALISLNPQLNQGLKAGDVIRIPKKSDNSTAETTVVPDGMHLVQRGETIFSLAKLFGVPEDELYIANPSLQTEGLKIGSFIFIPQKGNTKAVIQDGFIEHTVKQGETIYSITKLYKITFAELLKQNPELQNGLKTGMVLKIPLQEGANIIKSPGKIKRIDDNEIHIGLLLPFHLKGGNAQEKNISTDILIGAKMALDSLAGQGKIINLKVMDSENRAATIEELIATHDFSKFDAVVGPLFATNFKSFALMMEGSGIPVVSPLGNTEDLLEIENVVVATPTDKAIADKVMEEIKTHYKGETIQILTDERNRDLADYVAAQLKKTLSGAEVNMVFDASQLEQKSRSVDEKLSDGTVVNQEYFTPVIMVLVSDNNTLGNAFVEKLQKMNAENLTAYGIKYVSAYDIYNEKNKSNIAALKNIGFTFGTIRLVNIYGTDERNTLNKFMDIYCATPNEFQQIGFDVVYDLVERMNRKGDVLNSLTNEKTRLATKFSYQKSGKAYQNQAVRVVRLFVPQDESPDDVE